MSLSSQSREAETRTRILDAAQRCVENVGFTRTTLTDIAKTAGLSRMTIYRHYESTEAVLQDLMTREFNGIVDRSIALKQAAGDAPATRAQIVDAVITSADELTSHPLFQRILSADPELLLPYFTTRPGRFQQFAQSVLATALAAAIESGEVRADDANRLAGSILLAMRGYAFVDKSSWSKQQRAATLADLSLMIDCLLRPEGAE